MVNFDIVKYKDLYNYVFSNENGFIIKFYDNKLIGIIFGIRYGNTIFLSNLSSIVHPKYIISSLELFINSILEESHDDNIGHIYLSLKDEYNKIFNGKLLPVFTDYNGYGKVMYDNFTKISNNSLNKYPILPKYYFNDQAYERAKMIRILDLFKHNEEGTINDKEYCKPFYAGRSWYKEEDAFVIGPISDDIIEEIKNGGKNL